ncbi:DUF1365 domain-containing protein [Flexivirga lutea]
MTATPFLATVRHVRTTPLRHDFTYRTCSWVTPLTDTDPSLGIPWWQRPFVKFRAGDHLGTTDSWRANIEAFAQCNGLDLRDCGITALSGAATLGHAFDPLTLYWVTSPDGPVVAVIAEVRNTYGERHAYVIRPDERGRASVGKELYVSPFNDMSGSYTMSLPRPGTEGFDIHVTLHRPGQAPFVTSWSGKRPTTWREHLTLAAHLPLSAQLVSARIRIQGIYLWARRLPIQPRPTSHEELS